ncbi:MAG: hypothetical protein A2664_02340 [Candidatus Taylorbacteria bacterium RIFCSPHIGHO2_01_FULL_46_22b]|uniref:Cytochrome b5 heme-binding domain-containing protein n=1 Tax=Candidatus Taylorbacteria bacterium RIFCSPHIGHO2_01_FULL_46_22b TaxID=1802301 RepID=A0A1G2M322_9BACT|nr:MAG: hypothetical protein A2664_02340 [Candidatus Taylorbacteria bacterium RIFCSPHIGHO2_01_FULL_46_22b]
MSKINIIGGIIVVLAVVGAVYYTNRPAEYPIDPVTATSTTTQSGEEQSYTFAEVTTHNSSASCWSAINSNVYDLTSWIGKHPGGPSAIKSICGKDGSEAFNGQHGGQPQQASVLEGFYIGKLDTQ